MRAINLAVVSLLLLTGSAQAQNIAPPVTYADLKAMPVPVTDSDITDRPYRVVGELNGNIRRATVFSKNPSREKVYRELWERAQKLGADAVVKAEFGQARVTAFSWGAREARGLAVKFLTDAEIAALPKATPASQPQ